MAVQKTIIVTPVPAEVVEVNQTIASTVGPQGPKGQDGATGGAYTHTQGVSSNVWVITHNLNYYPSVTVIDSGGTQVEGETTWNSPNQLTLTFSAAFGGVAYLS